MKLTKENTKILQGIAILFMFGLHLFNRVEIKDFYDLHISIMGNYLLTYISYIFDACVPIYLFCSGYGLFRSEETEKKSLQERFHKIIKLLVRFWIILGITCIIGYMLGMKERYPGSFLNFILNVLLIKNSYVGAFWFVQTYTLLVLLSGIFYKFIKNGRVLFTLTVSVGLYVSAFGIEKLILSKLNIEILALFVNMFMLLFRSQFSFVLGMIFAKTDKIDQSEIINKIRKNKALPWIILSALIVVRNYFPHMIFAPFSAIILITAFGTYDWGKIGEGTLLFFGKHSTNMWLTHMQFYMIFTPWLVFGSRNVFVIMLTLMGLSLAASYIVDWIYCGIMKVKH